MTEDKANPKFTEQELRTIHLCVSALGIFPRCPAPSVDGIMAIAIVNKIEQALFERFGGERDDGE